MTHKISLVLGDWSHDDHNMTDMVTVEVNLTPAQIKKAYSAGTAIVGVDLTRDVCSEYEDHKLSDAHYEVFKKSGVLPDSNEDSWMDSDTFAELYLWVCKQGDATFTYKIVANNNASINIGGYGLFE